MTSELKKHIKTLRDMKDIQCQDGNWNCNPYMHGMANGLIFALSVFDNCEPKYLDAPAKWLDDKESNRYISDDMVEKATFAVVNYLMKEAPEKLKLGTLGFDMRPLVKAALTAALKGE